MPISTEIIVDLFSVDNTFKNDKLQKCIVKEKRTQAQNLPRCFMFTFICSGTYISIKGTVKRDEPNFGRIHLAGQYL
jgi:hypothetical protein